jgi:dolichol-phosphate mannosyltransferase
MMPWTLLLPGFCRYLGRRSLSAARRRPAALGFFLLSALWCLLFFSLSGCKRPAYILPAMPALALALGCYINVLVPRLSRSAGSGLVALWRWRSRIAGRATLLVLALAAGILILAGVKQMLSPVPLLMLASLTAAALIFFARRRVSWGVCAAVTFLVLALGVDQLQPAYNRQFALGGYIRSDTDLAQTASLPVACYPRRWDSVSFYLPQADVRVYALEERRRLIEDLRSRPNTLLVAKSGKHLEELLRDLPETMEFAPRGQSGFLTAGWVHPRSGRH